MRLTHVLYIGTLLCSLFMLTGCVKDEPAGCESGGSTRTLVFYMGGDNDLSGELSQKLAVIQSYASRSERVARSEINLLVYQDAPDGATLYRAVYGKDTPDVIGRYGIEDSSRPEVLNRVLEDCLAVAPADQYGLVVFSHASGWLPAGMLGSPRSVSRSIITDGNREMNIREFAAAIPPSRFDYVIFEACFMAGIEVVYELRDKVQYVVGSAAEMLSPGFLYIYSDMLDKLCCSLVDTPTSLCNAAQVYFDHYNSNKGLARSATISVIRTSGLDRLADYMRRWAPGLSPSTEGLQYFDRNAASRHLFFDLENYLAREIPGEMEELKGILANTVLLQRATSDFMLPENGFRIHHHSGLTIYIPGRFPQLDKEYELLAWQRAIYKKTTND